jgi:hypothetical protein
MEGHITPTVLLMHAELKSETSTMIETNPVKNGRPHNTHNYSMHGRLVWLLHGAVVV